VETDSVIAIVGLTLAIIELYVPKLSSSIEGFMNALVKPLLTGAKEVKNTPARLQFLLNNLTSKTFPVLLFVGLPALIILTALAFYIEQQTPLFVFVTLEIVVFVTLIPLGLSIAYFFFGGYLVYAFTALAFFIASPAWLIKMMNIMGNGKGVSGIGLALASYGVLALIPLQ